MVAGPGTVGAAIVLGASDGSGPPVDPLDSARLASAADPGRPSASAGAAAEVPAAARQIYETTMSPFCPSLLLANCPSPQADSLRRAIAARASAGASRAELEADLLATYGDVVRAAPPRHGFALAAWLMPGLVVTTAGLWVTWWARHRRPDHVARAPSPPSHHPHASTSIDRRQCGLAATVDATPDELATLDRLVRET